MTAIIVLSKRNKAIFSYIIIGVFVANKLKKFLVVKLQLTNLKQIKKFGLILSQISLIFSTYLYLTGYLKTLDKSNFFYCFFCLVNQYFFKLLNVIDFMTIQFGYYFYEHVIKFILQIFCFFFPELVKNINEYLSYFKISVDLQNLLFLISSIWFQIIALAVQIFYFFTNSQGGKQILLPLLDVLIGILTFLQLFLYLLLLALFPAVRTAFISLFRGNYTRPKFPEFFLVLSNSISNYIVKWLQTYHSYKTLPQKIFFAVISICSWLCSLVLLIKYIIYIKNKIIFT